MVILTQEDADKAAALVEYISKKVNPTPQEVYDLQANINTLLVFRIQQLELKVDALEQMFTPTPP